jgi:hypothetical protein
MTVYFISPLLTPFLPPAANSHTALHICECLRVNFAQEVIILDKYMLRAGFMSGAIAGLALSFILWTAYLVNILPYQVYIVTAGVILPPNLAFTIFGYLLGFLLYLASSGVVGIILAYLIHHRFEWALVYGAGFGLATLILFSGFFVLWFTPELPFWALPAPALYLTLSGRFLYGALMGHLYCRFMMLPLM